MKYYICSPIGRTGSKRLVFGLYEALQSKERMYISLPGIHITENIYYQGFKLFTSPGKSDNYTEEEAVYIMDEWESPITLHSHNVNMLPTNPNDWKFILSTRKRKLDTVLSILMAERTKSTDPTHLVDENFAPFEVSLDTVFKWMDRYLERENCFIKNVIALTGKTPTIVYLEDSWQQSQQKIGLQFVDAKSNVHEFYTKSTHTAKKYITNYEDLQVYYNSRLAYYQTNFLTETY